MLLKAALESPQSTHVSVLGPPVWRNQGQHKPSQTKTVNSTVSALVLPLSLLPDAHVSKQGRISLCHTPHSQEHHSDGAGGHHQEPQAKQHPRAAGAHQGGSLVPLPCQSKEASSHFWKHLPTTEKTLKGLILDCFYFIKCTVSSYENWCLEKWISGADEIFASLLLDCTSAHCDTEEMTSELKLQISPSWYQDLALEIEKLVHRCIKKRPLKRLMAQKINEKWNPNWKERSSRSLFLLHLKYRK